MNYVFTLTSQDIGVFLVRSYGLHDNWQTRWSLGKHPFNHFSFHFLWTKKFNVMIAFFKTDDKFVALFLFMFVSDSWLLIVEWNCKMCVIVNPPFGWIIWLFFFLMFMNEIWMWHKLNMVSMLLNAQISGYSHVLRQAIARVFVLLRTYNRLIFFRPMITDLFLFVPRDEIIWHGKLWELSIMNRLFWNSVVFIAIRFGTFPPYRGQPHALSSPSPQNPGSYGPGLARPTAARHNEWSEIEIPNPSVGHSAKARSRT
jgi:hypothetical protein